MKEIELNFYGYTWEKYAYQIAGKPGIYIVYSGHLDPEGFVVMNRVLYVGYHKRCADILDNEIIDVLRSSLVNYDNLFFSYAVYPSEKEGKEIAALIMNSLNLNKVKLVKDKVDKKIVCKGKCELIPNEIGV